jgi:hypothetical protein
MTSEAPRASGTPEDSEAGFSVYYPEPSEDEMLSTYRTYREGGGEPFEPYETSLRQRRETIEPMPAAEPSRRAGGTAASSRRLGGTDL